MKYKLAKQLKEAGYPQELRSDCINYRGEGKDTAYCPNLEELIEELGDEFINLYKIKDKWVCNLYYEKGCMDWEKWITEAKNPTEAVAKLYLKLNKK